MNTMLDFIKILPTYIYSFINFVYNNFFDILSFFSFLGTVYNLYRLKNYKKNIIENFQKNKDFKTFNEHKEEIVTQIDSYIENFSNIQNLEDEMHNNELFMNMFVYLTGLKSSYNDIFSKNIIKILNEFVEELKKNPQYSISRKDIQNYIETLTELKQLIDKVENYDWIK